MAILGAKNYNSFCDMKQGKKYKSWNFPTKFIYMKYRENYENSEKPSFSYPKNCCNILRLFRHFWLISPKCPKIVFFHVFDPIFVLKLFYHVWFSISRLLLGLKNVFKSLYYVKISKKGNFWILAGQYAYFSKLCTTSKICEKKVN